MQHFNLRQKITQEPYTVLTDLFDQPQPFFPPLPRQPSPGRQQPFFVPGASVNPVAKTVSAPAPALTVSAGAIVSPRSPAAHVPTVSAPGAAMPLTTRRVQDVPDSAALERRLFMKRRRSVSFRDPDDYLRFTGHLEV